MSNTSKENKSIFDSMMDAQKQVLDNMKSTTEQFTKNMGKTNPLEATGETFNKWYEEQMAFMNKSVNGSNPSFGQYQEMFNNWVNMQMGMFKEFVEKAQKNGTEQMNSFGKMNNNWMNNDFTKSYTEMAQNMTNSMTPWLSMLNNGDSKSAFEGMMNNMTAFNRFSEMWTPIMNQMQNSGFKPEMFSSMFNMEQFQSMINQMFGMAPAGTKEMLDQWMNQMKGFTTQGTEASKNMWNQMQSSMKNMIPDMGKGFFQTSLDQYNQMSNAIQQASSPLLKMMTPGSDRDQLANLSKVSDLMALFNTKNAEMSHLMYTAGLKAFEKLAEVNYSRIEKGEQPLGMMASYQEWLNINDSTFTSLFDTEEYSALQSELASTGMKLKKELDGQMEKNLSVFPLINRTEMDELYQTVYELKKKVRSLEKQLEYVAETEEAAPVAKAKPVAKKK